MTTINLSHAECQDAERETLDAIAYVEANATARLYMYAQEVLDAISYALGCIATAGAWAWHAIHGDRPTRDRLGRFTRFQDATSYPRDSRGRFARKVAL